MNNLNPATNRNSKTYDDYETKLNITTGGNSAFERSSISRNSARKVAGTLEPLKNR